MAAATQTARTSPQNSKMSSPKDSKSSLPAVTKTEGAYHPLAAARIIAPSRLLTIPHHNTHRPAPARASLSRPRRCTATMTNPSRRRQILPRSRPLAKINVSRPDLPSQHNTYANLAKQLRLRNQSQSLRRPMHSHWRLHQSLPHRQRAIHPTTSTLYTTPSR
jgi:hypothetical protein